MKVIGLTGGIASGKSFVAGILKEMGAAVVDADLLAREIVEPGTPAYLEIVKYFGEGVLGIDGTLDRKALGRIVFSDPEARKRLEGMTHPAIIRLAGERLEAERDKGTVIAVYMVPLLLEANLSSSVDEIWVVYADEETQAERLMERDGIGREEALRKIAAQMPMEEKVKYAGVVIDNRGSRDETIRQVRQSWGELLQRTEKL